MASNARGCMSKTSASSSILFSVGEELPRSSELIYVRLDTKPKSSWLRFLFFLAAFSAVAKLFFGLAGFGIAQLPTNEHYSATMYSVHFHYTCSLRAKHFDLQHQDFLVTPHGKDGKLWNCLCKSRGSSLVFMKWFQRWSSEVHFAVVPCSSTIQRHSKVWFGQWMT